MSGEITIERVSAIVSLIREDILKGGQYAFIFLTWLYERSKNEKLRISGSLSLSSKVVPFSSAFQGDELHRLRSSYYWVEFGPQAFY